jgi:hypothetical protein
MFYHVPFPLNCTVKLYVTYYMFTITGILSVVENNVANLYPRPYLFWHNLAVLPASATSSKGQAAPGLKNSSQLTEIGLKIIMNAIKVND